MQSLSADQARKLALISQALPQGVTTFDRKQRSADYTQASHHLHRAPQPSALAKPISDTLEVLEHLSYVQIDTISVVERAHHHVLWSRNPHYHPTHLDELIQQKQAFEYWSHAAAYLPMRDFRFSLPRKHALKTGQQTHWYKKDEPLMANILARIAAEGPLMAKDFASEGKKVNGWGSKPTKQALESLFMQGDLMICERRNFHKVYDLTENVLPEGTNTQLPTPQEHGQFLILHFLNAHGFGSLAEMSYLLKETKSVVRDALNALLESGAVKKIMINNVVYFSTSEALARLDLRLRRKQAKILSPFDNLLIQRKRASAIFNFDYLIECYVPAAKRQFGYFCLPILWDGQLIARADCKVDRANSTLNILHLFLEPSLRDRDTFLESLSMELDKFSQFNRCEQYVIQRISIAN